MKPGLLIFDLDGVLIDSKDVHYFALNKSLELIDSIYMISIEEHLKEFDGLTTYEKLKKLSIKKGLPKQKFDDVWKHKQIFTEELLQDLKIDENLVSIFNDLEKLDIKLAVASNSIKKTVYTILDQLGVSNYFDLILSNEDVINPKPHPEIYWKCMSHFGVLPNQTTIFEDSPTGKKAAILSGANLISISRRRDLDLNKINRGISLIHDKNNSSAPWFADQLNVLIPMAGAGTRFQSAGFTFPKPLIEVENKPMIQSVVENLNISANYIYIVQEEHFQRYNLGYLLNLITPDCRVVRVNGVTEGAACTTLLAKEFIDNDMPLLIANSDQIIEWNSSESLYSFSKEHLDGGIITFESTHPKWSYVRLDQNGYVEEVAEKKPISKIATVGIYYWSKGSDYVKYAQKMIDNNIRTNGEFYVAPVFNEAIKDSKKFKTMNIEKMWGIGTPEDLNIYLNRNLKTS
jgi:HAD superfamily hydrolase (TIGR01509 family)